MIIVSDTSVITNLIQLAQLPILSQLYGRLIIPSKVYEELERIPSQTTKIEALDWIEVRAVADTSLQKELYAQLDPGEAEAIMLALELDADILLIDEQKGRRIAQQHGLLITGLLGVLLEAKSEKLIKEIKPMLDRLIFEIGFRIKPRLYQEVLKKAKE